MTPIVGRKSSTGRRVHPRTPTNSISTTRPTPHPQNPRPRPNSAVRTIRAGPMIGAHPRNRGSGAALRIADNTAHTNNGGTPPNCTNRHRTPVARGATWANVAPPSIRAQPVSRMRSWSPPGACGLRIADSSASTHYLSAPTKRPPVVGLRPSVSQNLTTAFRDLGKHWARNTRSSTSAKPFPPDYPHPQKRTTPPESNAPEVPARTCARAPAASSWTAR